MKKTDGSLTIEASLSLTVFLFLFLSFIALGRYTTTQNKVKHSLNESAIVMSAKNNQLVKIQSCINNLAGTNSSGIVDLVSLFDPDFAKQISSSIGVPYTHSSSLPDGNKSAAWSNDDLKTEVTRYFAYYYLDKDLSEVNKMSYSQIKSELEKKGLKDVEITGYNYEDKNGGETKQIIQDGTLSVMIKYKIDVPFSLGKLLGKKAEPEFCDVVVLKLLQ
ncbi:MAG: pilus assembly protein [Ruminococcus sp.]|nr:pilus assembly protein [Ruminococcus sp.]